MFILEKSKTQLDQPKQALINSPAAEMFGRRLEFIFLNVLNSLSQTPFEIYQTS